MSWGPTIGAILIAISLGFLLGAWWAGRIRDEIEESYWNDKDQHQGANDVEPH